MKKRNLYITAFIISIFGLAIVQYQYLKIGLNLAKVQFNRQIGTTSESIKQELTGKNPLTFLVGEALTEQDTHFKVSIDELKDASSHFLDDFLTEKLVNNGINIDFSYELFTRDTTFYLGSPVEFKKTNDLSVYPMEIIGYLPELIDQRLVLELKFNNLNNYFLSQLNGLTIPSLLFILAIIITVIWVLRTYYWQRNIINTTNEFINNLTHELKTPVFSIGLATKILGESIDNEQKPIVDIIRLQVERLTEHIDKVLELGSLEANNKMFKLEEVDFRPFLLKLCKEYETLASMEEVSFSYSLEPGQFILNAEVSHLENALNNLLDNAKKYSHNPEITLEAEKKKSNLVIRITDNGIGIDKKDKYRIFQKFYRVPSGNIYNVKGYGLGLSYVKQVIKKLKGKIFIESEKGKGTDVLVSIPLSNGR